MKARRVYASILAVAFLCGLSGLPAYAENGYYKWSDQYGNPQHSDRPPPAGVEYQFVSTDTGLTRRVTAEESRAAAAPPPRSASEPPPQPTETKEEIAARTEQDAEYCRQAKSNLETLNSSARVRLKDADGTISYLTEEQKDAQRHRARDLITRHCTDA